MSESSGAQFTMPVYVCAKGHETVGPSNVLLRRVGAADVHSGDFCPVCAAQFFAEKFPTERKL